jgi:hypothetical protein
MVPPHGAQDDFRELRPQIGIDVDFRLSRQSFEVDTKPVGEAASVQGPIAPIERAPEVQHHPLDFSTGPEGLYHFRMSRVDGPGWRCHVSIPPNLW